MLYGNTGQGLRFVSSNLYVTTFLLTQAVSQEKQDVIITFGITENMKDDCVSRRVKLGQVRTNMNQHLAAVCCQEPVSGSYVLSGAKVRQLCAIRSQHLAAVCCQEPASGSCVLSGASGSYVLSG